MGFNFQIAVEGDVALRAKFSRFASKIDDFTPAWNLIAEDFYQLEEDLFNSQGASGLRGWAPLAPSTLRRKKGPSILVESGALRRSLTRPGGRNIRKITRSEARFGSKDPKVVFHFYGTRTMPRREPIQLTEADKKRWVKLVQRHLVSVARDSGLLSYGGA